MDSYQKITDHKERTRARLLEQYKAKPKIQGMIDALIGNRIQELEDAVWTLLTRLDIDASEGVQLDKIGTIVGRKRRGMDDVTFRIFLKAKIGRNTSEGDPEKIIAIWGILTQANLVHLIEQYPAAMDLAADVEPPLDIMLLAYLLIQEATAGGVRVNNVVYFTADVFKYAGGGLGNTGGYGYSKYAKDIRPRIPFAYKGGLYTAGYGSEVDRLVGGKYTE